MSSSPKVAWVLAVALVCLAGGRGFAKRVEPTESGPAKPALPQIESLQLEPASLTLNDGRDARQVLVWGVTADGRKFDVTDEATFQSDSSQVQIDAEHFIAPRQAGDGLVTITAAGKEVKLPVKVMNADQPIVRFTREVMPVLAAVGCNAGTCHGAAKGKNGFKLSLRGYDPDFDYNALVNELQGRRVNRV